MIGMKVIVGLGNPGEKYARNRHNVGFMVVDKLFDSLKESGVGAEWGSKFESLVVKTENLLLVKPQTFMNRSGEAVSAILSFYKVPTSDLYVVHDDLDIRLGEYKLGVGVGPKIHNGVNSVESTLGKSDFWRFRIGVDNRLSGEAREAGETYVLSDFSADEFVSVGKVIERVVSEIGEL